ncbi:type II secretion system protein GspC [Aliiglaciecola sp. CAU 1673]|uniref:type II secretion system protein GspC n=1 Tax=Aliiglaciecola sp. CAU 1673 TaxID=3032595 RepID=UPI0023DCCB01|nr:type II secretion system protein GspC [Aliiglaciecola sp. CAU 1673]MDF2179213.1 type II secretion system protein GspC [Aliiglaciecola sp. CAU 1673]
MIATDNQQVQQLWLKMSEHQPKIIRLLTLLLCLYLIAYAADLTWRLLPSPQSPTLTTVTDTTQANNSNNPRADIAKLQRLNLFGQVDAAQPKQEAVESAPQTNLNLTLTGVVASDVTERGAAIVEHQGKQNTYGVGDKVDGTNATVNEIYADRIIIKNGPRMETLMLDGMDYNSGAKQQQARPTATPAKPQSQATSRRTLSSDALEATHALQAQPSNFTDYISISQHMADGELKGYRVSPGKSPTLFQSAGLKANDIVTEINGLDLTDIQQSVEAMSLLREANSLQLTIEREGELVTLFLDLPSEESEL